MKSITATAALLLLLTGIALAQNRPAANLKELPPGQEVTNVGYCRGEYDVSLRNGTNRTFKEYDLAFKVDSSANGPRQAKPALVPSGRMGDRAFVVFANLEELRGSLKVACRE